MTLSICLFLIALCNLTLAVLCCPVGILYKKQVHDRLSRLTSKILYVSQTICSFVFMSEALYRINSNFKKSALISFIIVIGLLAVYLIISKVIENREERNISEQLEKKFDEYFEALDKYKKEHPEDIDVDLDDFDFDANNAKISIELDKYEDVYSDSHNMPVKPYESDDSSK